MNQKSAQDFAVIPLLIFLLYLVKLNNAQQSLNQIQNITLNQDPKINSNNNTIESIPIVGNKSQIIPVTIRLDPAHYLHGRGFVATGTNITATADVEDAKFKNSSLTYQWFNKNGTITNANASILVYKFDKPEEHNFLKVSVTLKPNGTGISQKNLTIRDPIKLLDSIGKTNIEQGELLELSFHFNGTGPFEYCHRICPESDSEGCEKCNPDFETWLDRVNITHYRPVSNYSLLFTIDNIVSRQEKRLTIRISEAVKRQKIAYVPIISSISAVFILLIGVGLHLKFKRTVHMETADFDFTRTAYHDEEEWDEEQSFFQRVIYLLFKDDHSDQGNLLNTSLSDSRIRLF